MKRTPQALKTRDLAARRENIILFTFYAGVVICLVMVFFRLFEKDYPYALLTCLAMLINILLIYLVRKGYAQAALQFSSIVYLVLAFNEGYRLQVPLQSVMYFSMMPIFIAFLMQSSTIRIIYIASWVIAFIILNLLTKAHSWADLSIYILITPFGFGITLFFISLMEEQQLKLETAYGEKKKNLAMLEQKHQEILLFNNMMNHDLKTPLRTIKGFTSLLRKKERPFDEQREYLDFIANSADNLESLISDLLVLTKIDTVNAVKSRVDLDRLIEQVRQSLAFDINLQKVAFEVDGLPKVEGSPEQIRTVVQNIISNAIKYQPKHEGHIPLIKISYKREGELDAIYFQDNGIGIDKQNIEKLFDPFVRFQASGEYEGTGLGMTICKKIMQNHQGDIMYLSNDKLGTCIKIVFPIVAFSPAHAIQKQQKV